MGLAECAMLCVMELAVSPATSTAPPQHSAESHLLAAMMAVMVVALFTFAGVVLWLRYGLTLHLDRLAGTDWNCF